MNQMIEDRIVSALDSLKSVSGMALSKEVRLDLQLVKANLTLALTMLRAVPNVGGSVVPPRNLSLVTPIVVVPQIRQSDQFKFDLESDLLGAEMLLDECEE